FGGFDSQSHAAHNLARSTTLRQAINQSRWDEEHVIDGAVKLSAVTETSSIARDVKLSKVKEAAKAKLAAATYDEGSKSKKKKSSREAKAEKTSKSTKSASKSSRRSRRSNDVANYDDSRGRRYVEEREYRPRVASGGGYYGHSDGGRSAGQTMADNFRPL
ncbi:MAG: hypothetical protein WC829_15925, partial [Hyphomicrobium sp.]